MSHRVKEEAGESKKDLWNQNQEDYGHHPCGNLEKPGSGKTCLEIQEKKVKVIGLSASRHVVHKRKQRDTACEKVLLKKWQITKMRGCVKLR